MSSIATFRLGQEPDVALVVVTHQTRCEVESESSSSEHHTAPRAFLGCHTHFLTCVGSRTATVQCVSVSFDSFVVVSLKQFLIIFDLLMPHPEPQLLDVLPHAQFTNTPASVLLTSHRDHRCEDDPRQGAEFGRLAEQSLVHFKRASTADRRILLSPTQQEETSSQDSHSILYLLRRGKSVNGMIRRTLVGAAGHGGTRGRM